MQSLIVLAIEANGMVFISGQLPINPATGEMPEGVTAQTEQSLKNLEAILNEAKMCPKILKSKFQQA